MNRIGAVKRSSVRMGTSLAEKSCIALEFAKGLTTAQKPAVRDAACTAKRLRRTAAFASPTASVTDGTEVWVVVNARIARINILPHATHNVLAYFDLQMV